MVVARNLRTRDGELDLLVRRGRTWIGVEVKARRDHPAPERCVEAAQLDRIERALHRLARGLRPRPAALRIDVVSVRWTPRGPDLLHFPAVRHVAGPPLATGCWRRALAATRLWSTPPALPCAPLPLSPMAALAEQLIPRRKLLLMLCETALFMAVVLVGTSVPPLSTRQYPFFHQPELVRGLLTSFTIAVICQASLSYNDLYDWKTSQNRAELPNRLLHAAGYALVMLGFLSLVAGSLFVLPGLKDIGDETWKLIALVGVAFVAVYLFRHAFHWFFYKWRFGERVLVVGSSIEAQQLARMVLDSPMSGFEMLGIVEEPGHPSPTAPGPDTPPVLGTLEDLRTLCRSEGISRVVVALRERRGKVPVDRLLECRMDGVMVEEREAMYERLTGKLAVESMRPSYLIYGRGFAKDPLTMVAKRVLDILAALIGLLLSLPLCLVTALLIKLTSPGPVFFRQERTGQDGATFKLVKFRTMRTDAEKESGPVWAQKNDARVTRVGRLLRLTRIDEIPQFLNILAGQMSFVGPRPERPHFVAQLQQQVPFYPLRHTVKPGLTGWAQVRHPYGASIEDAQEKLRYDLYYIKNMSVMFDLNIILRTVGVILGAKGAR